MFVRCTIFLLADCEEVLSTKRSRWLPLVFKPAPIQPNSWFHFKSANYPQGTFVFFKCKWLGLLYCAYPLFISIDRTTWQVQMKHSQRVSLHRYTDGWGSWITLQDSSPVPVPQHIYFCLLLLWLIKHKKNLTIIYIIWNYFISLECIELHSMLHVIL